MRKQRQIKLCGPIFLFLVGSVFLSGILFLLELNNSSDLSVMLLDVLAIVFLLVAVSSLLSFVQHRSGNKSR